MTEALHVWMNGERVGVWEIERGAHHTFRYAPDWPSSLRARPLSLSLPITASLETRGPQVVDFFDNLLPDSDRIRRRLGQRFHTSADTFALLEAIGRDCVGAIQLLPEGEEPDGWNRIDCEPLTQQQVAEELRRVPAEPLGAEHHEEQDAPRISIAGAQEKTALLKRGGQWCRPRGATPTSHIFKLPLGVIGGSRRIDFSDSVENEWLCAQILRALGLPVATTEVATFDEQKVLVVERFDRQWMDGEQWIARLPQEDFCQALGLPSRLKYEADGGPGMARCLGLLADSEDAQGDGRAFLLAQLGFWLLAATDGHAKNYSLFLRAGGRYGMTPLYDVISVWPYIGDGHHQMRWRSLNLAMALRATSAHYRLYQIQARHWHDLARQHGGPQVWAAMLALVEGVEPALAEVEAALPGGFPPRTWESIRDGMREQVRRFTQGMEGLAR